MLPSPLWFALAAASCAPGQNPGTLVLTTGGRSSFQIVAEAGPPAERFAAEELRKYLELVSGARLPIVAAASGPDSILVGRAAGQIDALSNLGGDSYLIRIAPGRITLAGVSPRATLYGVYDFLERYAGWGWLAPRDEHIPVRPELKLPDRAELSDATARCRGSR